MACKFNSKKLKIIPLFVIKEFSVGINAPGTSHVILIYVSVIMHIKKYFHFSESAFYR